MKRKRGTRLVEMFLVLDDALAGWPDSNQMVRRMQRVSPAIDHLMDRFDVEINGDEPPAYEKTPGKLLVDIERNLERFDWCGAKKGD
jgi:hypothetical protein